CPTATSCLFPRLRRLPPFPLFPYTTLFRSLLSSGDGSVASDAGGRAGPTVSLGRRPRRGPPDGGGSAPVLARELLDDGEQTRVDQSAVALLDRRGHELGDVRAERGRPTGLACGGGDDAHVLVVQLQAESGVEGAVEHLLPLLVEDLGAGESAAEHLERRGGLDSVGFEEDHCLGQQTDVAGDDELVGGLDRLA